MPQTTSLKWFFFYFLIWIIVLILSSLTYAVVGFSTSSLSNLAPSLHLKW